MATNPPGVVCQSITRGGCNEPFDLQVARNQITFHTPVTISGFQAAVGTVSIPLWEQAAAYVFPVSAGVMTIVSTSTLDTGSIIISGLDASYNPISETVILNGTTGVNTTNSYFRVNSLVEISKANAGVVTAKNGGVTYAQINVGIGQSQNTSYTVPNGYTLYISRVYASTNQDSGGGSYITYQVVASNVATGTSIVGFQLPFIDSLSLARNSQYAYPQATDLQFQMAASASTAAVGMVIEGYLIANNGAL